MSISSAGDSYSVVWLYIMQVIRLLLWARCIAVDRDCGLWLDVQLLGFVLCG